MKGIESCKECAYYDMVYDFCSRGAVEEDCSSNMFLKECPLPDVEPVRRGKWEHGICGQVDHSRPNYCPNCGAKMDEVK